MFVNGVSSPTPVGGDTHLLCYFDIAKSALSRIPTRSKSMR